MRKAGVLVVELFPFVGAGGQLVQLFKLPQQALALLLQTGLRGLGLGQRGAGRAPSLPAPLHGVGLDARVVVQQGAHRVGVHQALPSMLAVDVQQQRAQMAQLGGGGRAAVDPGTAAPLGVDHPAQQQGVFGGKASSLQPELGLGGGIKFGADVRLGGAFAHYAGISACAQYQLQRVDQNGFARTGFAGQYGKARRKIQLQRGHDDKVPQNNAPQAHERVPCSFQPSFLRRVAK